MKKESEKTKVLEERVFHMVWDMLLRYDVVKLMHILLGANHGMLEEEQSFVEGWGFGKGCNCCE